METVIDIVIILLVISVVVIIAYVFYMTTKRKQYPQVSFARFIDEKNNVAEIEQLANKAIRGVNGWMWLATVFMALYYFLNFWTIVFMMINLVTVVYEIDGDKNFTVFLILGSLLFSFLDLWLNSKEKSIRFHTHWFNTSKIAKEYIVKFSQANTFEELCSLVIEFNNLIYEENIKIQFL